MQYLLMLYADETGWSKMTKASRSRDMQLHGLHRSAEKGPAHGWARIGCSQLAPQPPSVSPIASPRCSTARISSPKSSSVATISSTSPGSRFRAFLGRAMPRCQSRHHRSSPVWAMSPQPPLPREAVDYREGDAQARDTAEAVARRSYGKLVAFLAARTRDVPAAEDALSEAFASALADWPVNGCPPTRKHGCSP